MNRNSSRICGRNTTTEPTPFQTPSTISDFRRPAGSTDATQLPECWMSQSTAFCAGVATLKMDWNTATTTARNSSGPATGCRNTASSRRVHLGGAGAWYDAWLPTRPAHWRHLGTSCRMGSSLGAGFGMAPARKSKTWSTPSPRRALTSATGAPNSAASLCKSTWPPRLRKSSAMLRITRVGRPSARIGAASIRWRPILVESSTSSTASGLGVSARCPVSTSCATCSSSERGERL